MVGSRQCILSTGVWGRGRPQTSHSKQYRDTTSFRTKLMERDVRHRRVAAGSACRAVSRAVQSLGTMRRWLMPGQRTKAADRAPGSS